MSRWGVTVAVPLRQRVDLTDWNRALAEYRHAAELRELRAALRDVEAMASRADSRELRDHWLRRAERIRQQIARLA